MFCSRFRRHARKSTPGAFGEAVKQTDIFSLQPCDSGSSLLMAGGRCTNLRIPGLDLLRQYATGNIYLLVTDYDCPFEEAVNFITINKECSKILCRKCLGGMGITPVPPSYCLSNLVWKDDFHFYAIINEKYRYDFTIRRRYFPYLLPQLKIRCRGWINGDSSRRGKFPE